MKSNHNRAILPEKNKTKHRPNVLSARFMSTYFNQQKRMEFTKKKQKSIEMRCLLFKVYILE